MERPSGQIDSDSIQTVIDKLRDLSAAKFADKMTWRSGPGSVGDFGRQDIRSKR